MENNGNYDIILNNNITNNMKKALKLIKANDLGQKLSLALMV